MRHQRSFTRARGQAIAVVAGTLTMSIALGVGALVWMGQRGQKSSEQEWGAAKRGSFDITIPCSGELAALNQIEIRNELESEATITQIMDEGKWANAGDVLLKFNDEELRTSFNEAVDQVNLAEAAAVTAESELNIKTKERESQIAKAAVTVQLAELDMQAWLDGEDTSKRRRLKLAVETAQKSLDRLIERYETSKRLCDEKFLSLDELKQDEIQVIEGRSKLDEAQMDLDLYEKYQCKQEQAKKSSDLEQARGELERTKERQDSMVRSAQSELESKKLQLQSKHDRKRLLEQQLGKCNVVAPAPGMVVYSSSMESGRYYWGDGPPRVGAKMYPNMPIIFLPDTTQMAATVKVSEALSNSIKVGQRASVVSDAQANHTMPGEVTSIGVLAESSDRWRDPNRRDYTVKIKLGDVGDAKLKPCMRCTADILVDRVQDVLYIPVQGVFWAKPDAYVYVPDGRGVSQRRVVLGRTSETFAEIKEGLAEGDRVLLREPLAHEIKSRLPASKPADMELAFAGATTQPQSAESDVTVAEAAGPPEAAAVSAEIVGPPAP